MKILLALLFPVIAHAQTPLDRELIAAAERGDLPSAKSLIARGANVNASRTARF